MVILDDYYYNDEILIYNRNKDLTLINITKRMQYI